MKMEWMGGGKGGEIGSALEMIGPKDSLWRRRCSWPSDVQGRRKRPW